MAFNIVNPRSGQFFNERAANAALIAASGEQALAQYQNISMKSIVGAAMEASGEGTKQALGVFLESLRSKYSKAREYRLAAVHRQVAQDAQISMLTRYSRIVEPRSLGAYRNDEANPKWRRYSGGILKAAIADPSFYRASKDGIMWGSMEWLDSQAPQWYRLNYGAGARGAGYRASQAFPSAQMKFFQQTITASLIPSSFSASGAYLLPKGVFGDVSPEMGTTRFRKVNISSIRGGKRKMGSPLEFGAGGMVNGKIPRENLSFERAPFNPISYIESKIGSAAAASLPTIGPKLTRGFAGSFFIEAGLQRMSRTLPAAYEKLMTEWFKEAAVSETGPIAKLVDPTTANVMLKAAEADINRLAKVRDLRKFVI